MALSDVSRFASLPADRWRALADRLRAIGAEAAYEKAAEIGGQLFPPMSLPLRRWHLERMGGPVADALLLLALDQAIAADAARAAIGGDLFDALAGAGLFVPAGEGLLRAAVKLWMFDDLFYFADDLGQGGEAVMGPAQFTSTLMRLAGASAGASESALELGCGAAVAAIHLARRFRRVVATDINPRAIVLARVNAALNGVDNVEVRLGDLYEPVAGERFDLVVCQPPFIAKPDEAPDATYMYGGKRGDELPLRMTAGIAAHLGPQGRGLVVMELPVIAGDAPIADRVRAVVPESANLLLLDAAGPDPDALAVGEAAHEHPDLGPAFARSAVIRREHLDRLGVEGIRIAVAAIAPAASAPGWTRALTIDDVDLGADAFARLLAAAELLARGRDALLAAKVRPAQGISFAIGKDAVEVIFPPGSPRARLALNHGAHRVVTLLDGAPTVQIAVNRFRKEGNYKPQDALDRFLPAVSQLLAAGVVEVG
jgi:SAM-dependent methyltransferase